MDASRPSPSLGPRTPEHTKLTATHAEVMLPSLDLPPRKRLSETLKDGTLRSEQVDFATLSSSAARCNSPMMQPNSPDTTLISAGEGRNSAEPDGTIPSVNPACSQGNVQTANGNPTNTICRSTGSLQIVPWIANICTNVALQRYFMCGDGTPKPTIYHSHLEESISNRLGCLDRDEREVAMYTRVRADELKKNKTPPTAPYPCPIPDLYYLLRAQPQMLDWNYEGQTAAEFYSHFE